MHSCCSRSHAAAQTCSCRTKDATGDDNSFKCIIYTEEHLHIILCKLYDDLYIILYNISF
jgi:hypothetical protein